MFRHQDVANDKELVTSAHEVEGLFKQVASRHGDQVGPPPITTKGDEVETSALLVTDKTLRHANMVHPVSRVWSQSTKSIPGLRIETWGTLG
jgi:hypothetical protein